MAATVDSQVIRQIHEKEKNITDKADPLADGPTAAAQKHAGTKLDGLVISDITAGEKHITNGARLKGGPTSVAQSILAKSNDKGNIDSSTAGEDTSRTANQTDADESDNPLSQAVMEAFAGLKSSITLQLDKFERKIQQEIAQIDAKAHSSKPKLDSKTISTICAAEREISGNNVPVRGGPTAQAQKHVGEYISSDNIQAVSQGEKRITESGEVAKDGPTAILERKLCGCTLTESS